MLAAARMLTTLICLLPASVPEGESPRPVRGYRLADATWTATATPGVEISLVAGDPKTGAHHSFLKLRDGAQIVPHWHSSDEYLTVLSGTIYVGTGVHADHRAATRYGSGSSVLIPARTPHYGWTEGECVLSQTRTGAFDSHSAYTGNTQTEDE